MAYKNMKSNKNHIKKLRKDPNDYYNKRRKEKKNKKLKTNELSYAEMEKMIEKLG